MKILMVTPYVPYPPASGGQIRTLNLLKYLQKKHYIVLVALSKDSKDKEYIKHLKNYCDEVHICKRPEKPWMFKNIFKSVFSLKPFLIVRNFSEEASSKINELLQYETFDVIHCETFYVMPHIPLTKTPVVLVEQTIEFLVYKHFIQTLPIFLRLPLYLDIWKLRYWERLYWKKAALMATVSEQDKKTVIDEDPQLTPIVIPNGAGEDMIIDKLPKKMEFGKTLLFQGNFAWLQNKEAAEYLMRKLYPHVIKRIPDIKVKVAGQHAQALPNVNGVKIVNIDPKNVEEVKKLYRDATLFIAPIFGPGGTRLKILAAMASGLPIVSSQVGVEGLEVENGKHVLIANSPAEFVDAIDLLLKDPILYESLRINAFELVQKKYNWKTIAKDLETAYLTIKNS